MAELPAAALADYAIARHYPAAAHAENPYLALLESVIAAQADLVAQWMLVGFIHGVMNTDNMTISGESIDYGPCAFMEAFDPYTVYSSIDHAGRYAYGNQPVVAEWNLARFAETLLPLFDDDQERAVEIASRHSKHSARGTPPPGRTGCERNSACPKVFPTKCRAADHRSARAARAESRRLHVVLPRSWRSRPRRHRTCAWTVHRSRRIRRLAGALAPARPGCRGDGPGQPDLHPAQPSRRRGAGRRHRG